MGDARERNLTEYLPLVVTRLHHRNFFFFLYASDGAKSVYAIINVNYALTVVNIRQKYKYVKANPRDLK